MTKTKKPKAKAVAEAKATTKTSSVIPSPSSKLETEQVSHLFTAIKMVVVGDLHLKRTDPLGVINSQGINTRLQDKLEALSAIVTKAIVDRATHLIFLGDIFDAVNPPEFLKHRFWSALKPAVDNHLEIRILLGNHDTTGVASNFLGDSLICPSHVKILSQPMQERLLVEGKPEEPIHVTYLPYMTHEQTETELQTLAKTGVRGLVFGHFEVEGAELAPDNSKIQTGFDRKMVCGLGDLVWLGHIHKHQKLVKDQAQYAYVGSVVKCDFGELTNEKMFGVIDIVKAEDGELSLVYEFLPIPQRPMFQVVVDEADTNNLVVASAIDPRLLAEGILLKLVLRGTAEWIKNLDRLALKRRFPQAMRVVFAEEKQGSDRQSEVLTSNIIDQVHELAKRKQASKVVLDLGVTLAKQALETEL